MKKFNPAYVLAVFGLCLAALALGQEAPKEAHKPIYKELPDGSVLMTQEGAAILANKLEEMKLIAIEALRQRDEALIILQNHIDAERKRRAMCS